MISFHLSCVVLQSALSQYLDKSGSEPTNFYTTSGHALASHRGRCRMFPALKVTLEVSFCQYWTGMSLIKELSFSKHIHQAILLETYFMNYVCLHGNSNAHQSGTRVRSQDQFYWLTFLNLIFFTFCIF